MAAAIVFGFLIAFLAAWEGIMYIVRANDADEAREDN